MSCQVMPPLSDEEYAALKADVAENGVRVAVVEDDEGGVLDGHHRKRAWEELTSLGFDLPDYPRDVREGLTEQEKLDVAVSLNLQRRHLSRSQHREVIATVLKQTPERSNRWVAEVAGCDHKTVGDVRRKLEAREEISKPARLYGKDGKSYVRLRYGGYVDEDRRRDKEHAVETYNAVRGALIDTPKSSDQAIADEFNVSPDFVEEQRADLEERGPSPADLEGSAKYSSIPPTAEEAREIIQKRRERTKELKDQGELKGEDSVRAVELIIQLGKLLHLGHSNEDRRITPPEAVELYIQNKTEISDRLSMRAQDDIDTVERVDEWMEEFKKVFTYEVNKARKDY